MKLFAFLPLPSHTQFIHQAAHKFLVTLSVRRRVKLVVNIEHKIPFPLDFPNTSQIKPNSAPISTKRTHLSPRMRWVDKCILIYRNFMNKTTGQSLRPSAYKQEERYTRV
jgi:hypothetical protein